MQATMAGMRMNQHARLACLMLGCAAPTTLAQTNDHNHASLIIHDSKVSKELNQALTGLVARKATLNFEGFRRQLERRTCFLSLPAAANGGSSEPDLYRKTAESVLVVAKVYRCNECGKNHTSTASGFIISQSGAFVTSYHVLDDPRMEGIAARTQDGTVRPVREVLVADKINDFVILQLEGSSFRPIPLAREAPVGSTVYVLSHPDGYFYMLTRGIVSRAALRDERGGTQIPLLDITADFAKGSSGAPVLNDQGAAVGIVRMTQSIYYSENDHAKNDLQMVIKRCTPAAVILDVIK